MEDPMKKRIAHGMPKTLQDEWRRMYGHSNHNNISRGAENRRRSMHSPHGEEWRAQENKRRKAK
jgi:hypothetical protein